VTDRRKFNCSKLGVEMNGSVDERLFILYTNADVPPNVQSNKTTDIGEEKFLMTGGSVLQFNEEKHKAIYNYLRYLPNHREFLSRFRIFYSQTDAKDLDFATKLGLRQSMNLHGIELDELSNKCKQSAITNINQLIQSHKTVLIFAPESYHPHHC
jgi:hypothetical protein